MRQSQNANFWAGSKSALGALALILIGRFSSGKYGAALSLLGLVIFVCAAAQTAVSVWRWQRQRTKERQNHSRDTWRI